MKQSSTLTTGVIWKQLLLFAIPILISNLFQQIYSMTDTLIVGNFVSSQALAAVGSTGSLINMIVGFFLGLSAGAGVLVAQAYGAKDDQRVHRIVHTAIALSIASGVFLMVVGVICSRQLLLWMHTPDDVLPLAIEYLEIYFMGIIGVIVYNLGSGILRAIGDSIRPLCFLIFTVVLNIILDFVFVACLQWGVAGAGWATAISQVISAILVCIVLMRTKEAYRIQWKQIRFHFDELWRIIKIGLPTGMQSVIVSFSNVLIQSSVNTFGSQAMAGVAAAGRIDGFIYMPMASFGIAITTFVGQNIGARKWDRVRKSVTVCLAMTIGISIVMGSLVFVFTQPILCLFDKDPEVIRYGSYIIHIIAPTYFIFAITDALSGAIRGAGKSHIPMLVTLIMLCGIRMLWILLVVPWYHDLRIVYLSYPVSWILSSGTLLWYYCKGYWLKGVVDEHEVRSL
ncbi:MAG: MATE family efflux transporter [Erysipelotrichaceae bacterium]|nr:MATE family efflux transporter [Erysipelotrichaceae bacterium]